MKANWMTVCVLAVAAVSVSSVLWGCSTEIPAQVIIAASAEPEQRAPQRRAASAGLTDVVVESTRDDFHTYARITDKTHGVVCYSVMPSTQGASSISCLKAK